VAYHLGEHTRRTPKNWYLLWVNLRKAFMIFAVVSLAFAGFIHVHGSNHGDAGETIENQLKKMQNHQLGQLAVFGLYVYLV